MDIKYYTVSNDGYMYSLVYIFIHIYLYIIQSTNEIGDVDDEIKKS